MPTEAIARQNLPPLFANSHSIASRLSTYLTWPRKFRHECETLGVRWPSGILLTGPPGVGKTTLVQRTVADAIAQLYYVNAADVVGSQLGATERRLRDTFRRAHQAAQSQAVVVFIDEIDAVCPQRSRADSHESRFVAQLLTLMDGVNTSKSRVVVIAATNRIEAVDPALRRPGRFDMEIQVPLPNEDARLAMLQQYTTHVSLGKSVDLTWLASITSGFTGADIKALCRETLMIALGYSFITGPATCTRRQDTVLEAEHFGKAMCDVGPSMARGISNDLAPSLHTDVGGYEGVKSTLNRFVQWHAEHPSSFTKLGLKFPKGILLYGPPGCGKTTLASIVGSPGAGCNVKLSPSMLFSKHLGEGEGILQHAFQQGRAASPSVIIIDDIDIMFGARNSLLQSASAGSLLSVLLMEMDGLLATSGVTIVATSSHPWNIDPALLRPGRLEKMIYVPTPDLTSRVEVLKIHTRGAKLSSDVDLHRVAKETEQFTCAELRTLCLEAMEAAKTRQCTRCQSTELRMQDLLLGVKRITPAMDIGTNNSYYVFIESYH